MNKLIFPLLTLAVVGFTCASAHAEKKQAQANGDSAIIQSVDMKVDQYGENNRAVQSGEVYNRTQRQAQTGSTGIVQTGNVTTIQTGAGNEGRSRFRIENESGISSPRYRR
ncbi:hypothetical protein [Gloeothece verrucosa]|uniref:Uncharacterized protein n=1 Tax=Gloeothece verrucosa (strain PCC 7822) TaxID=497965 RepID=E0UK86_GLOV7|nr:hypothetical protein [Gloeothece verrucosa]ADN15848.1 hypothetical protein Cyan7822_3918 [Gloeothece verrucosa PCC 7822]